MNYWDKAEEYQKITDAWNQVSNYRMRAVWPFLAAAVVAHVSQVFIAMRSAWGVGLLLGLAGGLFVCGARRIVQAILFKRRIMKTVDQDLLKTI